MNLTESARFTRYMTDYNLSLLLLLVQKGLLHTPHTQLPIF